LVKEILQVLAEIAALLVIGGAGALALAVLLTGCAEIQRVVGPCERETTVTRTERVNCEAGGRAVRVEIDK
jgi:hypothetical protein